MKVVSTYIAVILSLIFMGSCLDDVDLNLPNKTERLVIYGWVSNLEEPYIISVTKSNNFNLTTAYKGVKGAKVFVTDRVGKTYVFQEDVKAGIYKSNPSEFIGVPGQKYELHVNIPLLETENDSVFYKSIPEELKLNSEIDSVFISNLNIGNSSELEDNYYLSAIIQDLPNIKNYYRWKLEVNRQLRNVPSELVIFDDKFTDGNNFEFKAENVLVSQKDTIRLFHMSLTSTAFKYFSQLKDLTGTSVVGPSFQSFDLKGNIFNVNDDSETVLGYFGASDIEIIDVPIQ